MSRASCRFSSRSTIAPTWPPISNSLISPSLPRVSSNFRFESTPFPWSWNCRDVDVPRLRVCRISTISNSSVLPLSWNSLLGIFVFNFEYNRSPWLFDCNRWWNFRDIKTSAYLAKNKKIKKTCVYKSYSVFQWPPCTYPLVTSKLGVFPNRELHSQGTNSDEVAAQNWSWTRLWGLKFKVAWRRIWHGCLFHDTRCFGGVRFAEREGARANQLS